jgi:hypothetical protein
VALCKAFVLVGLTLAASGQSQDRFTDEFGGEFRGFAKSPTEHIVDRLPDLVVVKAVAGEIRARSNDEPLPNVLFEIRGPGAAQTVRSVKANALGRFSLGRVRSGEYVFKATLNGFQSLVGRVRVTKTADPTSRIEIKLNLGV